MDIIKKNEWLTDKEMAVASQILSKERPDVGGLQDPVLGQKNQWNHPCEKFVQFLHVNGNHWITISNIGEEKCVVNIYDSLHLHPTPETENLIAKFIKGDFDRLTFRVQQVQKQCNSYDCGVFAIAFATSLLHGDDPTSLRYSGGMRQHLLDCLMNKKMTPFLPTE